MSEAIDLQVMGLPMTGQLEPRTEEANHPTWWFWLTDNLGSDTDSYDALFASVKIGTARLNLLEWRQYEYDPPMPSDYTANQARADLVLYQETGHWFGEWDRPHTAQS